HLRRFERLFDLPVVLQEAQIGRDFVRRLRQARERMDDAVILLAGVGLARDELALFESSAARELSVELLDPRGIAAEEEQERRLRAGGPLGAEKSEIGADTADLLQVQKQVRG